MATNPEEIAMTLERYVGKRSHAGIPMSMIIGMAAISSTESLEATLAKVEALLQHEYEIECYPYLTDEPAPEVVRLYRTRTAAYRLMKMFAEPSVEDDKTIANDVKKIQGKWDWGLGEQAS